MDTKRGEAKGASPQAEDGHIDIANEISEALARTHISGNEWKVLWVILRKTYGWHKKMDCISITQFQKGTGLDRRNAYRAMLSLVNRNIVVKNDNGFIGSYGFQKDYTRWKAIGRNNNKAKTVVKNVPKLLSKSTPTKETTKEINKGRASKKLDADPRVPEFKIGGR